jgi:two-component system, LuxR family, sensor kinase FixL
MSTRPGAASHGDERPGSPAGGARDAVTGEAVGFALTQWSETAEKVLGIAPEEVLDQPFACIFISELTGEARSLFDQLSQGRAIDRYETVKVLHDGRTLDVELSAGPIYDASGRLIGSLCTVRNITEQKALRARLAEVQSELLHVSRLSDMGQLASAFAHELSQPLSAISAYIGGTRRLIETGDTERALEGYDRAVAQVARAGEVIRRLREFVRKSDGQRVPEDLGEVIGEAMALVLGDARREGLVTEVRVADEARTAIIDRVQIQQVLVNLFRNAVEAMAGRSRKHLTVTTRRVGAAIEVEVADSGPGLADEVLARLFQPFVTTKASGMGVGLSLCRNIIESQGGEISARNGTSGGAVFRFTVLGA